MRICSRLFSALVHFHNPTLWPNELKTAVATGCRVTPSFITEEEENELLREVEPHMKRLRYEKSHWDDQTLNNRTFSKECFKAIHLYREREQRKWSPANEKVIQRIRDTSFPPGAEHLSYVHILDLHKDGVIKPHIDSIRYCGDVITGVCLLSDAVMRLRHKDRKDELIVDLMLPRRCLYRMGEEGRYEFTHEVLSNEESIFNGKKVEKTRRISIICRDLPHPENQADAAAIRMKPIPEAA
ncbi:hypothetical protein ANCCEY_03324 [Ancylostoma ceylanicum]|uniref:Alpha-ketoglutarate-dependent dioxygenase AlkB-like domain-containing protein n=1 Tax=Ancylostoma ceylanicum TaxID=53326 RepID=A0A0D6M579_9BILA|nr:hypothetical protein ANCCEY_03324 [Ancylostoma ceylanicum]